MCNFIADKSLIITNNINHFYKAFMKNIYFLLLGIFICPIYLLSQVDDPACLPPKKKIINLLEKAKEEKERGEAVKLYREAIKKAPDNATPYYAFARFAYKTAMFQYKKNPNPKVGDRNLTMAEGLFKKTLNRCPDFRSDCYYYLGIINYTFGKKAIAMDYFKQYKTYDSPDIRRYDDQRQARLNDIEEVLKKYNQTASIRNKEVPFSPYIVKNVSTDLNEYFPMISPDNELMFFTRKVNRAHKGDLVSNIKEEFTWAKRNDMNSPFNSGTPLKPPFNDGTFESYGAATLSVDNKEMIICGCKVEKIQGQMYKNCDLYSTTYRRTGAGGNDYIWTPLKNLGTNINTQNGWEGQPSLSADGNTLYYATNRPNSQNTDIYSANRKEDGTWELAQPFNLINTPGIDKSPFIHPDNETFYFVSSVSKQRKGLGGTDIYYMRKNKQGKWGAPINIGYPINTKEDEIGLFVSIDGKDAYYSSRYRGNWNIYAFDLYKAARPQEVVVIKGKLAATSDSALQNVEIQVSYSNTSEVTTTTVNGNDGKYAVIVKANGEQGNAMINIKKEGYAFDSKIIAEDELAKGKTIQAKDMDVKEIKVGEPYTINDILYQTASAKLSSSDQFILRQFSRFLKNNPTISILIQGHTDNVGSPDTNLKLSEERAQGVKAYLIECGIKSNRLAAKGYGQTMPKVPNNSTANRAKNRRTDFVIQKL